jgi:hypothetical protein
MLGPLKMTVPDAIYYFKDLSTKIFKNPKINRYQKATKGELGIAYYDGDKMVKEMQNLIKNRGFKSDLVLQSANNQGCRV